MLELIVIIITVIAFIKASKNKPGNYRWGLLGLLYYVIGRVLFSILLYGGYKIFSNQEMDFRIYKGLRLIELFGGIFFAVLTAYVLGEISGLNIKRVFKSE